MKRIKYHVIHCTTEERDRGVEHYERFDTEAEAKTRAGAISNDEFVAVEKHNEIFERNEWRPNWDMGENWFERIDY